MQEKTILM